MALCAMGFEDAVCRAESVIWGHACDSPILLDACMSNPPFYELQEQVRM